MARTERNPAITFPAAGQMVILERTWFQWVAGIVASLSPAGVVFAALDRFASSQASSVGNLFIGVFLVLNGYLFYTGIQIFDGTANWTVRWALGAYMKLLAIAHAVGAMYLVAQTRDGLYLPNGDRVPDGLIWIVFGFWWNVAALAYLTGDAHIRIRQRETQAAR
jgi:hypothetical protein